MLSKRIIPCLDIKDGKTVKGINFLELRDAGDPVELAKLYADQGADAAAESQVRVRVLHHAPPCR